VFDQDSPHNVGSIIRLAEENRSLFSKEALAAQARQRSPNADEWLPDYLTRVYVPTTEDFRRLRRLVKQQRAVYGAKVRDMRRKHFPHTEVIDEAELSAIFARASCFVQVNRLRIGSSWTASMMPS
jgi:hypothetical protein